MECRAPCVRRRRRRSYGKSRRSNMRLSGMGPYEPTKISPAMKVILAASLVLSFYFMITYSGPFRWAGGAAVAADVVVLGEDHLRRDVPAAGGRRGGAGVAVPAAGGTVADELSRSRDGRSGAVVAARRRPCRRAPACGSGSARRGSTAPSSCSSAGSWSGLRSRHAPARRQRGPHRPRRSNSSRPARTPPSHWVNLSAVPLVDATVTFKSSKEPGRGQLRPAALGGPRPLERASSPSRSTTAARKARRPSSSRPWSRA